MNKKKPPLLRVVLPWLCEMVAVVRINKEQGMKNKE